MCRHAGACQADAAQRLAEQSARGGGHPCIHACTCTDAHTCTYAQAPAKRAQLSLAEQIAEAGAISPLVKLLVGVDGEKSSSAQAEAAGALWALAGRK